MSFVLGNGCVNYLLKVHRHAPLCRAWRKHMAVRWKLALRVQALRAKMCRPVHSLRWSLPPLHAVCVCVRVHMYVRMWVYECVCVFAYMCVSVTVHVCICACVSVYLWVCECMSARVRTCAFLHVCVCVRANVWVHVCMCVCVYACVSAPVCMFAYVRVWGESPSALNWIIKCALLLSTLTYPPQRKREQTLAQDKLPIYTRPYEALCFPPITESPSLHTEDISFRRKKVFQRSGS